jgi:RimJ/RimL family protein N-acetyltransferase
VTDRSTSTPRAAPDVPSRLILAGRHVRLEPLSVEHVDGLVAAATQSRDTYGYAHVPADRVAAEQYVRAALDDEAAGLAVAFATCRADDGTVVGSTRFLDLVHWDGPLATPGPSAVEIGGTWLAPSAQRTPINTETKLLMLTHAFETWEVHRVTLKTDARNARSRSAIERLGALFEGVRRAHVPAVDGTIRDSAYYSIVRAEWPDVRARLTLLS